MGANPQHTLLAFREAEAYPGPALILAYSHCIAHGFDLRHGHEATGPGGRQRSLAAVPFQSGHAHRGRAPLPAGLAAADDPAQGLRLQGAALPHARANRSRGGAGAAGRGAADRDREVPAVRGAGQPRRRDLQSRRHPYRDRRRAARRDTAKRRSTTHGSDHQVHGPHAAKPADRVGLAAQPGRRNAPPARGSRGGGGGAAVDLRGGDPRRAARVRASRRGAAGGRASRRRRRISRPTRAPCARARALSRARAAGKAGGRDPGDRQLERHDARGVGRLRAPPRRGRGRRDRAQRLFHPGRPDDVGPRRGAALPGDPGGGQGGREASRRDQA